MLAGDMVLDFEPTRFIEGRYLFFSGMNLLHEGDIETAMSDFSRSIQMDPNEAALSRYGLALAYSYRQELGKAEEEFEAAGKLWPTGPGPTRLWRPCIWTTTGFPRPKPPSGKAWRGPRLKPARDANIFFWLRHSGLGTRRMKWRRRCGWR